MRIDWDRLLPSDQPPAAPLPPSVQMQASGADDPMTIAEAQLLERVPTWAARAGDDRRYCLECGFLRERRCAIAQPGGRVSAARGYEPIPGMLRRCEGFAPLPDDPDQRPGVERWSWLVQSPCPADSATSKTPQQLA